MALTRSTLTMMLVGRLKWIVAPLLLGTCTTGALIYAQGTPGQPAARRPARAQPRARVTPRPTEEARLEAVPPVVVRGDGTIEIDPPPGYFDLPPGANKGGPAPAAVKPGQTLTLEVLEALPGRPLAGERLVRPDGTISLGFYGDLPVAGLDRRQIKLKLIEHMRKYLNDEVLGLVQGDAETNKVKAVPPLESDRVFVDDTGRPGLSPERSPSSRPSGPTPVSPGQTIIVEVLQALPGRPITGERVVRPDGTISLGFYGDLPVAGLTRDEIKVKVIEHLRKHLSDKSLGLDGVTVRTDEGRLIVKKVDPAESTAVFVDDSISYLPPGNRKAARGDEDLLDRVDALEDKLDRVLRELRELRRERRQAEPRDAGQVQPF
jgi:protein involved in polysaccharide export with SLBB domain